MNYPDVDALGEHDNMPPKTIDMRPLPAEIRALSVSKLPRRLGNLCAAAGMFTIGEIADQDLSQLRSVGRRLLRDLPLFLAEIRNNPLEQNNRWRDMIDTALPRLRPNERRVVTLRAGLKGLHATRTQIARELEVTPTRVGQIEIQAIERMDLRGAWTMLARERLERLVGVAVLHGSDLGLRDPFFAVRPGEARAFEFLVNRVLRGCLIAVCEDEDVVISRFSKKGTEG